jgi:hypothetical protein
MIPSLRWRTGENQPMVTPVESTGFKNIFVGGPIDADTKNRIKDIYIYITVHK